MCVCACVGEGTGQLGVVEREYHSLCQLCLEARARVMNNNAWLGRVPVDVCLMSDPSFVERSLIMPAQWNSPVLKPFPFVFTMFTVIQCVLNFFEDYCLFPWIYGLLQ